MYIYIYTKEIYSLLCRLLLAWQIIFLSGDCLSVRISVGTSVPPSVLSLIF